MKRSLYTLLLRALAPLIWLWMLRRARRAGGDWGLFSAARFARRSALPTPLLDAPVWVHAVSLGETRAAQPLLRALLALRLPVLLTHTTPSGRAEGARQFAQDIDRGQLYQTWLPYDFPGATRRFMAHYAPRCGVLIEREIWPNLLAAARHQHIPMAVVSARFSAASLRHAAWMGAVLREALGGLDHVLAQTDADAQRLVQAGAQASHVTVTGNLKFDLTLCAEQLQQGRDWRVRCKRPVVAIASTREGEDALFVRAIQEAGAGVPGAPLYVLIPRHPQRFQQAAALLRAAGLSYLRRSSFGQTPGAEVAVVLGDTLGDMAMYYAAADVAIVAGSFAPLGGQNLIEACAAGAPVIVGPHTQHFTQVVEAAIAAGAALRVADPRQAVSQALALLRDTPRRQAMCAAARIWAASQGGATARTLHALGSCVRAPNEQA
jgi:3-deoxy-D-manno-octulosonic-acid transferase